MFALIRVGVFAALVTLASIFCAAMSVAADKAFERADLAEAAIKLEAQIKSDAGAAGKPLAQIAPRGRRGVPEATTSATAWCCSASSSRRLRPTARTGCGSRAPSSRSGRPTSASARLLLERAATAAYIAYQRDQQSRRGGRQPADRRPHPGRPANVAARRSTRCGCRSNCARSPTCARSTRACASDHGFRMLDYSVDADAASPRACFQFSEDAAGQAHRLLAVRRGRRHGQAGAVGRAEAALRRGPQARRALQRHPARRACRRPSRRRWRSPPSSRSTCATASRSCASPARPTCCRAPASAAFRWSPSTPGR